MHPAILSPSRFFSPQPQSTGMLWSLHRNQCPPGSGSTPPELHDQINGFKAVLWKQPGTFLVEILRIASWDTYCKPPSLNSILVTEFLEMNLPSPTHTKTRKGKKRFPLVLRQLCVLERTQELFRSTECKFTNTSMPHQESPFRVSCKTSLILKDEKDAILRVVRSHKCNPAKDFWVMGLMNPGFTRWI